MALLEEKCCWCWVWLLYYNVCIWKRISLCIDVGVFCLYRMVSGEGNGTPLQYSCLENPMDGGAVWAAVHAKGWTWLSDFTFTFHFHALEKEMATHSSVLAWRIPGTEGPGGLPSVGSHRVGHDWSDLAAAAAHQLCWANWVKQYWELDLETSWKSGKVTHHSHNITFFYDSCIFSQAAFSGHVLKLLLLFVFCFFSSLKFESEKSEGVRVRGTSSPTWWHVEVIRSLNSPETSFSVPLPPSEILI